MQWRSTKTPELLKYLVDPASSHNLEISLSHINLSSISLCFLESLRLRCTCCGSPLQNPTSEDSMSLIIDCPICKKPTNLFKTLKLIEGSEEKFNEGSSLLGNGELEKASLIFTQLIRFFDNTLVLPFKDYNLCQEALRKCLLPLGNQTNKYWD